MSQKFFEIGQNAPKNFISAMEEDNHLLLLYEDFRKALDIQIDFIKKGLENSECCIFAMPYQIDIEQKMIEKGIDIQKMKNEKKLHILPVNYKDEGLEAVDAFKKFSNQILSVTKDKVRICGMLDFDISTKEGMETFIEAETTSHENFHSFSGSWLCSYNISKIEEKEKISWIKKLFKCHDSVIIVPLNEGGIVFDLE